MGTFCKLSSDVLLEHLRDLFFCAQVFQSDKGMMFHGYVISMNEIFNSNAVSFKKDLYSYTSIFQQGIYFLEESTIELVDKISSGLFGTPESKTIRDVPPKGFTVGDVQAELKYLGLLEFFPNIGKYAEIAFKKVVMFEREDESWNHAKHVRYTKSKCSVGKQRREYRKARSSDN